MDSNKDEAQKCVMIGKAAMEAGDRGRAIKFFTKAQRLYPNVQVDAYLSVLYEGSGKQAADEKDAGKQGSDGGEKEGSNVGLGRRNGFNHAGSSGSSTSGDVSTEQIEIVQRIRRTRDYYEILSLAKDCTEEDVKKAYRKLSLKVHPDKNKAPGAEEAFKAVSKAFSCLSDAELREKYDRYGPEEEHEAAAQQHVRRRRDGNMVFYEDIFEANDVFNSFFFGMQQQNGGFRRAHFTRAHGPDVRRQDGQSSNWLSLLQLIPIIALFLFSYFPFSQPVYQLESVSPYIYRYTTKEFGVNFYVKSTEFDREHPPGSYARRQVEAQVDRDYREVLVHNCRIEQGYARWGHVRETPHCDKLKRFKRVVVS